MREPARAVPREKPNPAPVVKAPPPPPFADRTCRPIWDLGSSLWRLSEEGRCWARHPKLLRWWPPWLSLISRLTLKAGRARLVLWPALISLPGAFFLQTMVSSQG